jgi:hypothetical protein
MSSPGRLYCYIDNEKQRWRQPPPPQPYNSIKLDKGWVESRDSPSELRRTLTELKPLMSYAIPCWATLHPILSNAAFNFARPYQRHVAPDRAAPHPDWATPYPVNVSEAWRLKRNESVSVADIYVTNEKSIARRARNNLHYLCHKQYSKRPLLKQKRI